METKDDLVNALPKTRLNQPAIAWVREGPIPHVLASPPQLWGYLEVRRWRICCTFCYKRRKETWPTLPNCSYQLWIAATRQKTPFVKMTSFLHYLGLLDIVKPSWSLLKFNLLLTISFQNTLQYLYHFGSFSDVPVTSAEPHYGAWYLYRTGVYGSSTHADLQ